MSCSACKIIINGGMVAPLAAELANKVGGSARGAANELAAAARSLYTSYTVLREQGLIERLPMDEWTSCEQATTLTAWIAGAAMPPNAAEMMGQWATDMRAITVSLVSGTFTLDGE